MVDKLTHLKQLEAESIHIIREVAAEFDNPVMLYSIGKDSAVMLHLARKAFFPGKLPFPVLHKDYMERYKNDVIDLGHVFEGTESGLVVPRYMVEAGVRTISDLLKDEAKKRLRQTITGIDAGAGVMVTTENEVMPAYGLTAAGYTLLPSSGPAMMAALKQAIARKEWIVVTGWKPHSMFGYWDLAFLEQDKDKVWGVGNIHIMGRKTLREDKPELAKFLEKMQLTNSELGSLMVAINESKKDTLDAARDWMNENEAVIAKWLP